MEIKDVLNIASEFSDSPGARYRVDGDFSGEEFLELLKPRFEKAVKNGYCLLIDLDGIMGLPSSFVSGSFGLLSKEFGPQVVLNHLRFKSEENNIRESRVIKEINNPNK